MSKHLFTKKRLPLFLCIPLLLILLGFLFFTTRDTQKFDRFAMNLFREELSGSTLDLHYTLAYPEKYGINQEEALLPCYSASATEESTFLLSSYLEELAELSTDKLTKDQQYTYTLLSRYLIHTQEGKQFTYYEEPLSPSSGMQSQLPILLAEYTFRSTKDIDDYLSLLDQTDEYFSSLLVYETEKKEAGLLQADSSLQKVIEQCYSILSKAELEEESHFLQITFLERLLPLFQSGLLSKEDLASYLSENNRLLRTVMQPAYENLADGLFLLMGDGTSSPTGLSSFPEGKEYYTWLVKKNTGSSLSIEELKELLYPHFNACYKALQTVLLSNENALDIWTKENSESTFPLNTAEEFLLDLQNRMAKDFPAFPTPLSSSSPGLLVKNVSESLADYCAPAFYLSPPLDDLEHNVIYINEKRIPSGMELYTTLAHEGYPGHLYQSVYSQQTLQDESTPVRQLLWYGGYQEGWALYVEFLSYDYASELAKESGNNDAAFSYQIEKHNRDVQLCLYALLDIAIHYDNASYEKIHQILSAFGISNPDTTRSIYDYIAEEPANYLKYYVGYLEILELKEAAMAQWKDAYTDLKFHTFILDAGPSDFDTLSESLEKTIF